MIDLKLENKSERSILLPLQAFLFRTVVVNECLQSAMYDLRIYLLQIEIQRNMNKVRKLICKVRYDWFIRRPRKTTDLKINWNLNYISSFSKYPSLWFLYKKRTIEEMHPRVIKNLNPKTKWSDWSNPKYCEKFNSRDYPHIKTGSLIKSLDLVLSITSRIEILIIIGRPSNIY